MSSSFLKDFGEKVVKCIGIVSGSLAIVEQSLPVSVGAGASGVEDTFIHIVQVILAVEAMFASVQGKTGPDKLRAAVPLVAQLIQSSEVMVGKRIKDEAKFIGAVQGLASNTADFLNSLEAGSTVVQTHELKLPSAA
jgi:hypothetical protein